MTYLLLKGTKREWIKLFEANDIETKAILRYEHDKNLGIEPIYYPEADIAADPAALVFPVVMQMDMEGEGELGGG